MIVGHSFTLSNLHCLVCCCISSLFDMAWFTCR